MSQSHGSPPWVKIAGLPKGDGRLGVGRVSAVIKRERVPRRALRLPVTFWRPDSEEERFAGYSTNVSNGGMFVATWRPLPPNALVELEIEHTDRVVRTTARVMHAARYPAEFSRIFKSGMGVRFARPEDAPVRSLSRMGQLLADRDGRRRFLR